MRTKFWQMATRIKHSAFFIKAGLWLLFLACFLVGSFLSAWPSRPPLVGADSTRSQFEQEIEEIEARVKQTNIRLDGLAEEGQTLEQALESLDSDISLLQAEIASTQDEIDRLQDEINRLQDEIEAQTAILSRILVLLYQRSGASSLELLITAETFSDYLNDQEYLDRLQGGVSDSVLRIQQLKGRLQDEEERQLALLESQQAQQLVLEAVRREKGQLLAETQNQEELYQAQLSELRQDQEKLEEELEAYLASLLKARVTLGRVNAGDIIGKNGNTGWSTGPHLHIIIRTAQFEKFDPLYFIRNNDLVWPMGGYGGWVSQGYHAGHRALDIAAPEGTPILAVADGEIIHRGCLQPNDPKYASFGVIINHGDYLSVYLHLQAPNNPEYSICSINRRTQHGVPSIDYSLTE